MSAQRGGAGVGAGSGTGGGGGTGTGRGNGSRTGSGTGTGSSTGSGTGTGSGAGTGSGTGPGGGTGPGSGTGTGSGTGSGTSTGSGTGTGASGGPVAQAGQATARACANIALVKYWGKRDAALNLPAAGSLSLTLSGLVTTTTVRFGEVSSRAATGASSRAGGADAAGVQDTLVIDGITAGEKPLRKAQRVLDLVRARANITSLPATITSSNDFPTGAGLASSASGLAALTVAAARAAGLTLAPEELSRIARVGSGSACRSLFGGFVEWNAGRAPDGSDSHAHPVAPPEHWDLRVLVAVVQEEAKSVDSTSGMTRTAETSPFHAPFLATVDADLATARTAIAARDFAALARVSERSSLRMHAAMMGADPALIYLRPESFQVLATLRALQADGVDVFFTADAGPNVKAFCTPAAEPTVRAALSTLACVRRLIAARPGPAPSLVP